MSTVTVYGHTFTVPDRYAEGHVMTAAEATALNDRLAEMISHMVRNGPLADLSKGDTPTAEQIAASEALIAERVKTYEFGAGRGSGEGRAPADPVQAEAYAIARAKVKEAIKGKGWTLAKKGEPAGEGEYPYDAYNAKVAEVAALPAVQAAAKKAVAARTIKDDALEVSV